MKDTKSKEQPIDLHAKNIQVVFNDWQEIANLADQENQTQKQKATHQKHLLDLTQKILREKIDALTHADLKTLFDQLQKKVEVENELLREALDFELLEAMQKKIEKLRQNNEIVSDQEEQHWLLKGAKKCALYVLLLLIGFAGIFKGISDGFNGVNALLSLIGLSGTPLALVIYGVFVLTGIAVYIAFDYSKISNALGVPFLKARGAIKKVYDECQLLEKMCYELRVLTIQIAKNKNSTDDVLKELETYKKIISSHILQLTKKHKLLQENQPHYAIRMAGKAIVGFFGASLFFSAGFFSGYSLAVGFFVMAVSSFPAIAIGFIVALAALFSYIALEGSKSFKTVDTLAGASENLLNQIAETSNRLALEEQSLNIHILNFTRVSKDVCEETESASLPVAQNIFFTLSSISSVQKSSTSPQENTFGNAT